MRLHGTNENFFRWCLAVIILVGAATTSQAAWTTIHNDFFQIDQNGNSVHTRSGCLRKFSNTYYWYGSANNFSDQTCYSSTDLMHWTYNGVAIMAAGTNRMDVIYNDSTKQYVMDLKYSRMARNCDLGIATSSTPTGPFTLKWDYNGIRLSNRGHVGVSRTMTGKRTFCMYGTAFPARIPAAYPTRLSIDIAGLFELVQAAVCYGTPARAKRR